MNWVGKHYVLFWKQVDYQPFPGMLIQWRETRLVCLKVTEMEECAVKNHLYPLGEEVFTAAAKFQHRREGQDSVGSGIRQCFISTMNRSPWNTFSHWLIHFQCLQVSSPNNAMSPQRQSTVLPLYSFWHIPHRGSIDLWALSDLKRAKQLKARLRPQLRVLQQAQF